LVSVANVGEEELKEREKRTRLVLVPRMCV
jgi:hypothetical protein